MQQSTINKISCLFLICTLVLGITPKILLHTLAANHKDVVVSFKKGLENNYSKAAFNCNVENSVAHSPYLYFKDAPRAASFIYFASPIAIYTNGFFSRHHFYGELRGPPFC